MGRILDDEVHNDAEAAIAKEDDEDTMPVDNEFNAEEVLDCAEISNDTAAVIAVEHVIGVSVVSKTEEIHLLWLGINEEIVD